MRHLRPLWPALLTLWLAAPAIAQAADLDALDLVADEPAASTQPATRVFVEGSFGPADLRYDEGNTVRRLALDGRYAGTIGPSVQAVLSARLDDAEPDESFIDGVVFSLREAYLGWQDATAGWGVEAGRINLREGPGYGYNPTDFFRASALRAYSTANPLALREQRMGSAMLRAQHLWASGSVAALYSPKLASSRSDEGFSLDWGATNALGRGLVSLGNRWSERVGTQLIAYKEAGSSPAAGASLSALVSDAAVVFAEWSYSREPTLLERALALPASPAWGQRAALGLTYTTRTRLSVTLEYDYNDFALDRDGWRALSGAGLPAQQAYYTTALDRQDSASRHAFFLYALQRDLGIKNLQLTALARFNESDRSRLLWLDLRYLGGKGELALQLQSNDGAAGSGFGISPIQNAATIVGVYYF